MCWTMNHIKFTIWGGYQYAPYIYDDQYANQYQEKAHRGNKCFNFYYPTATLPDIDAAYLALPLLCEDLKKLQMQFFVKLGHNKYVGDTLFVGVMSDPNDIRTFDTVGCLPSKRIGPLHRVYRAF